MSCSATGIELLREFKFIRAVTCPYTDAAGSVVLVALLVFGAIALYLYIRQDSVILPLGVIMMGGGSLLSVMIGPAVAIATLLILVVPAGYIALAYFRHS